MTISSKPTVIGLSGTFASGKDTLAKYLSEQCGYIHISTSDIVHQEALRRFGNSERAACHRAAKLCREEDGAGIFVKKALAKYVDDELLVVSGLRVSGEADEIKKVGGMLVFVDANIKLRYERMKSRNRDNEAVLTFDEFQQQETKEWQAGSKPSDFNLKRVEEMADVILENNTDLDSFLSAANEKLAL